MQQCRRNIFVVCLFVSLLFFARNVNAQEVHNNVVRVSLSNFVRHLSYEEDGKLTGYADEYLSRIAQLTGWEYEYVESSFVDSFKLLEEGKIDLIPGAMYSKSRAEKFLYSSNSMMKSSAHIVCKADDKRFVENDYEQLNGMKIGVLAGSTLVPQLEKFKKEKNLKFRIFYFNHSKSPLAALNNGEVDLLLIATSLLESNMKIVYSFGMEDMFFVVNKNNKVLYEQLEWAINKIHFVSPYFENDLFKKYYGNICTFISLTEEEKKYIENNPEISVGYRNNYLPFSNTEDGKAVGYTIDVFNEISKSCGIKFKFVEAPYPQTDYEFLSKKSAQLFTVSSQSEYCALNMCLVPANVVFNSEVVFVGKKNEFKSFKDKLKIADYQYSIKKMFKPDYLHDIKSISHYENGKDALISVKNGKNDYAVMNVSIAKMLLQNPRFSTLCIHEEFTKSQRIFISMMADEDPLLLSIINKCFFSIDGDKLSQFLINNTYITENAMTFSDFLFAYISITGVVIFIVVVLVIFFIVIFRIKKKNEKMLIEKNVELSDAIKKTEAESKAKSDFLSRMSHDIRTPLAGIIGMTDIAVKNIDNRNMAINCLDKIGTSAKYMLSLLNDILDMAKIERNKIVLNEEACSAKELIESIETIVFPQATEKNISLDIVIPPMSGQYVLIDKLRFQQVFINLLSNAIKFTPCGGRIDVDIKLKEKTKESVVMYLTIKDTGIGMSEEYQKKLFTPYERDLSNKNRQKGVGLGLSIVKHIVDLVGGSIRIESKLNEGTTVFLRIKMKFTDKPTDSNRDLITEKYDFSNRRILIVDDEPINIEIASVLLGERHMKYETAEDGETALKKFQESYVGYFDAILMDIRMPGINGWQVARLIRNLDRVDAKTIPIIAMTANAYDEDAIRSRSVGMDAHITKPFDPMTMFRILYRCFVRSSSQSVSIDVNQSQINPPQANI